MKDERKSPNSDDIVHLKEKLNFIEALTKTLFTSLSHPHLHGASSFTTYSRISHFHVKKCKMSAFTDMTKT